MKSDALLGASETAGAVRRCTDEYIAKLDKELAATKAYSAAVTGRRSDVQGIRDQAVQLEKGVAKTKIKLIQEG